MSTPKKSKQIKKPELPTRRRAAAKFRLNKNRDDFNPGFDLVRIFIPSPLLHGGDIGVSAAPAVVLLGYEVVRVGEASLTSVQLAQPGTNAKIVGRMVDLHPDELARLDQVAEHLGRWHRFLAEVKGPLTGHDFSVWVFQHLDHATAVELKTSVTELPQPNRAQLEAVHRLTN